MVATPNDAGLSSGRTPRSTAKTPNRRALSVETQSSSRRPVHTPLNRTPSRDLANSVRHGTSTSGGRRNNNAPTPHAKAARRALNDRRNAIFTPGKNRRRSQGGRRESPRGLLRMLGRKLALTSEPILSSSPQSMQTKRIEPILEESDDDELPIDRPRLSLPLSDDEDDDSELEPPRSSGLEDNMTVQSIELPRRAVSEQPPISRLSRGSFGSLHDDDFSQGGAGDFEDMSDFFPGFLEDMQAREEGGDVTYERIDADPTRRTTLGRDSDFGLQLPAGIGDQTTFLLSEPGEAAATSPIVDGSVLEAHARQEQEPFGNVAFAGDDTDVLHFNDDIDSDEENFEGLENVDRNEVEQPRKKLPKPPRKKQKRMSKHGIEYPPLPPAFVKRVAQTALQSSGLSNPRVPADTLSALTQASDWFFEQLGDDLAAYASHAKRKTIEESDVTTLMRRQRRVGADATMFSLAQKHLPRELLQELRMPVPQPTKQRPSKRMRIAENEGEAAEIT